MGAVAESIGCGFQNRSDVCSDIVRVGVLGPSARYLSNIGNMDKDGGIVEVRRSLGD